jgi:hypothetical protein
VVIMSGRETVTGRRAVKGSLSNTEVTGAKCAQGKSGRPWSAHSRVLSLLRGEGSGVLIHQLSRILLGVGKRVVNSPNFWLALGT